MEENIKVSVVITAYNVEKYIKKAINSVLNQTYKNIEIVVVEDCSTDNTLKFIKGLQKSDLAFPINLVQHKENVGAGLSRRDGIKASTGDFIMLLDADDWLNKDYIEHLVDRQKETDADIVGGGITYCYEDTDKFETNTFGTTVSEGFQKFADYNDGKVVFLNNKIVRSTMYDTVEYCDRRYVEDTPVIMKLLYNANKVAYVNEAGYNYLQRNTSLCHVSSRWKHNLFCALCCAELIEWFKDKPEPYKTIFGLGQFVEYLKAMNEIQVTKEEKQTYIEEYDQCMKYLISHIS
jgi:glycosyltransferase involved in cell wall biosynthesis